MEPLKAELDWLRGRWASLFQLHSFSLKRINVYQRVDGRERV
jgi:hypothetical protein